MEWIKRLLGIQNGSRKSKDHVVSDKTSNREKAGRESLLVRFGKLYQPSVLLVSGSSGGFSRLGGLPQLSPEIEWPEWNNKPQAFLAQIDLGELNQALPSFLPNKGRLYFFYDQEQGVWGFDPKDVAGWRVLYDRATEVTFTERAAPAGLPGDCIYKPKWITPQKINLLPDSQRIPRLEFDWDRDGDSYVELREEAFAGQIRHQMLGYPSPVQNDSMELECQLASNGVYVGSPEGYRDPRVETLKSEATDWKLLLQLDTD